jgi:dTDP-glucose 4,6-dehydratase
MSNGWQGKRILVTGAGGFIASHLVEQLVRMESQVRALVRYNSRGDPGLLKLTPPDVIDAIEILPGDLRDLATVQAAMRGVSLVYHLGALISIPYSYIHPVEVVETNILGTLNVLEAGREAGVERIVHTSSSEVYGTALQVPIREDHPLQGQSPYSASKIGADKLAESYYRAFNLPVVTLRPFNTYGPRQSARAVVPTIITQVLTADVIRLGNLQARRDLTYVDDTVAGFICCADAEKIEGETFNLGIGEEISVGRLVEMIVAITGKQVDVQVDDSRLRPEKSEVQRLLADNRLARERLGWSPAVSLEQGLHNTVQWIREHLDHYRPGRYQV